jgi:hypothetical protein
METRPDGTTIGAHVTGAGQRGNPARPVRDTPRGQAGDTQGRPAARDAMNEALTAMMESCERYATAYATLHRTPIGCDAARGPILLEVLQGVVALASDDELTDRVAEIISTHALDLEE